MSGLATRPARTVRRALPAAALALTGATIAAGLLLNHAGVGLGTALPPFWMHWAPDLRVELLAGVAVAAALIAAAPWALTRAPSGARFAALAYGEALALGLAVNAARLGPAGWDHVFLRGRGGSYEAIYEYLPALRLLHGGVAHYVGDYARLLPYLPTHAKGNPPGPVVLMHLLGIDTAARLSAACIGIGALCAPLAYALGRELGDPRAGADSCSDGGADLKAGRAAGESRGRRAALLTAFSPAVVLFGVTSVDYAFAALATGCAWLLVSRAPARRAAGAGLTALASFASWMLLAIPVWAVLVVLRRDGPRAALITAAAAAGAIAAFTGLLALVWGYDPIAVIRALGPIYAHGQAAKRPYAFWVFGSPAAFVAMLGAPVAWWALRALARGEPAALGLAAVIAVSAIAGVTKAETERIWLPFVPLACVAAASVLPPRRMRLGLAVLAGQAILIEVLFATVW